MAGVLEDIKGTNKIRNERMEVLCKEKVHYIGDPILVVAAETLAQAQAALATVKVSLEELPVLVVGGGHSGCFAVGRYIFAAKRINRVQLRIETAGCCRNSDRGAGEIDTGWPSRRR